jgi:hypothetical protein
VAVLVATLRWPTEGGLEREAIYQVEFSPHYHSCRALSCLLNDEVAIIETKVFIIFAVKQWEDTFFEPVSLLIRAPIHKQILAAGVTMVVTIE